MNMMAECGSCGRYRDGSMLLDRNDNPVGFMCEDCWADFWGPMDDSTAEATQ